MMKKIYLDNAATTPIIPEVIALITAEMSATYGNPSSTHQIGRKAKSQVEQARKNIAAHFNAKPNEIVFTSGGSEADNLILRNAITNLGVNSIITSRIEHHAVLHTLEQLVKEFGVEVHYVNLDAKGGIDYKHLEALLQADTGKKTLVSLMYINNEIGNLLDLDIITSLKDEYQFLFHSDAVQGVGHFRMDVDTQPFDFFVASAHKFHGPKGVGFAFIKNGFGIHPILHGGEQERGARAGTENVHSILGMEKALELMYQHLEKETNYIQQLKTHFINRLNKEFEGILFNGYAEDAEKSSYIILNVRFPSEMSMLLFQLDLKGISASGGSACQSGSNKGSHVLGAILEDKEMNKTSVRFSFSKLNTIEEIDIVVEELKNILNK